MLASVALGNHVTSSKVASLATTKKAIVALSDFVLLVAPLPLASPLLQLRDVSVRRGARERAWGWRWMPPALPPLRLRDLSLRRRHLPLPLGAGGGPGGGGRVGALERMSAGRARRLPSMAGGSDGWGTSHSESISSFRGLSMRRLRGCPLCLCLARLVSAPKRVPL